MIPLVQVKQNWKFLPRFLSSDVIICVNILSIFCLRTSPIPIGLTPGFLSRNIRRHELYTIKFSREITSVAFVA